MFKKLVFNVAAVFSLAPVSSAPADFFSIEENPTQPGLIKIGAIYWTQMPQNRLWRRLLWQQLPSEAAKTVAMFANRKTAKAIYSFPAQAVLAVLASISRRAAEDGISSQVAFKSLHDAFYSLQFKFDGNSAWLNYFNVVKYLALASQIKQLLFDIENECADLEIKSNITQGYIPQNNNFFVLPTQTYLIAHAARNLQTMESSPTASIPLVDKATFCAKWYTALNHHIIPHKTILRLSPELQERCYDLSHHIAALNIGFDILPISISNARAKTINNRGCYIKRFPQDFKTFGGTEELKKQFKIADFMHQTAGTDNAKNLILMLVHTNLQEFFEPTAIELAEQDSQEAGGQGADTIQRRKNNLQQIKSLKAEFFKIASGMNGFIEELKPNQTLSTDDEIETMLKERITIISRCILAWNQDRTTDLDEIKRNILTAPASDGDTSDGDTSDGDTSDDD
ncbi:hypothetical protein FJ366_01450 [Candidatus Dependentiae bacterium]|nr:hypothetical protein [Candidatus Dependentiae bacterium]